jgi:hypothetical protein
MITPRCLLGAALVSPLFHSPSSVQTSFPTTPPSWPYQASPTRKERGVTAFKSDARLRRTLLQQLASTGVLARWRTTVQNTRAIPRWSSRPQPRRRSCQAILLASMCLRCVCFCDLSECTLMHPRNLSRHGILVRQAFFMRSQVRRSCRELQLRVFLRTSMCPWCVRLGAKSRPSVSAAPIQLLSDVSMQDGLLTLQGADAVRKLDELQLARDE